MTASEEQAKLIPAAVGEVFDIRLWEDRTRGELWVLTHDPETFELIDDEFRRTSGGSIHDAGTRTFRLLALKPGTYDLIFEKRIGWRFTPLSRRVYHVVVEQKGT